MCWGVPARVLKIDGMFAQVDFGGSIKEVLIFNKDIKPGNFVIVHAGSIIGKIETEEIIKTLELYGELIIQSMIEDGFTLEEAEREVNKWLKKLLGEE